MKIATDNKLAHYQVEVNEINEQLGMLNQQYMIQQQQVQQLGSYLSMNNGDTQARQRYRKATQELGSIGTKIRQKQRRLQTLQRQIMIE